MRVGIDLGTTYSAIARVGSDGVARVVKNSLGATTTPSVLCFLPEGRVVFGEEAKECQEAGDPQAVSFFKRSMGEAGTLIEVDGRAYTATDLSAILLREMVRDAASCLGEPIDSAVITVPAYFGARERQATIEAGQRAGLKVLGLLSEPSAAALAYGLAHDATAKTVLVYDLGGGTFDATVARIERDEVRVLGCDGNHHLGGKDWDDALARLVIGKLADQLDVDPDELPLTPSEANAILVKAEQAKRQLSARSRVRLRVTAGGESDTVSVERSEFEGATESLLGMTEAVVERLLAECGLAWGDMDGTIMVGGSTRMPAVATYLRRMSGRDPLRGVNPDEAVALGAAMRAAAYPVPTLAANTAPRPTLVGARTLVDSTAHAMGMVAESADRSRYVNSTIIPKNSPIPARNTRSYSLRVPLEGGVLDVYVLQGDADRVLDNVLYAKYTVRGIVREGERESTVEVSFGYTENATIEVSARQPATGARLEVEQSEPEDDLSRFDGSPLDYARATGAEGAADQRVMLALDVSASMLGEPLSKAKEAMKGLVRELAGTGASVGCLAFADRCKLMLPQKPLERDQDLREALSAIEDIEISGRLGYGNGAEPIGFWLDLVGREKPEPPFKSPAKSYRECLVVLTDGVWSTTQGALRNSEVAEHAGYDIVAIGFGSVDQAFLEQIATRGDYAALVGLAKLEETFSTIGRAIATGGGLSLG